jgi:Domain of unknown function (DUF4378)
LQEQVDLNKAEEPQIEKTVTASETTTLESHEKAYVQCILVKAGLYENQMFDSGISRWDMLNKPIPKWVFDKVEELFTATDIEEVGPAVSHRMLFDLTNEVLIKVLPFKKWHMSVPHGSRLLDESWNWIERFVQPRKCVPHTLDDLICRDLRENTWCNSFSQELNELETEIGLEIADELIDELFWDVLVNIGEITHK